MVDYPETIEVYDIKAGGLVGYSVFSMSVISSTFKVFAL